MQTTIPIGDASHVGAARRFVTRLATTSGASEEIAATAGIVASELATNLSVHATGGQFLVRTAATSNGPSVEMIAVDRGPGMTDVGRCLQDGYSTAGTAGNGLGAIRRLSQTFDVYSDRGTGTVVMARVAMSPTAESPRAEFDWAGISTPAPGEDVCGDAWSVTLDPHGLGVILADGLGHGPLAADAANRAITEFEARRGAKPAEALEHMHRALQGSRGAAVSVARIERSSVQFAGVGNVAGTLIAGERSRGMAPQNGTLGLQTRKVQQLSFEWSSPALIIMHSDGLTSRWSLDQYPGLSRRHPATIAAVLWRDAVRGRDDVTVVVVAATRSSHV